MVMIMQVCTYTRFQKLGVSLMIVLALLTACAPSETVTNASGFVENERPAATSTATPTATNTAMPTSTDTPEPTETATPTIHPTVTASATPEATETPPAPQPTEPASSESNQMRIEEDVATPSAETITVEAIQAEQLVIDPTATAQPPVSEREQVPIPESMQAFVEQILADAAAQSGAAREAVFVVSIENVMWNSAAIGCPQPDFAYAQVVTNGYRILVDAAGTTMSYHTNGTRRFIYCENAPDQKGSDSGASSATE